MALAALRKDPDLGVIIYSLDMPRTVIYDRIVCHETGLDFAAYLSGPLPDATQKMMSDVNAKLRQDILPRLRIVERVPLWKPDKIAPYRAMVDVETAFVAKSGVQKQLTIVDYFQLLPVEEEVGSPVDSDFLRVKLLQKLQERSRTSDNPMGDAFLVISEVRKGETGRTELGIADLMGSSRLGYAAQAILLMEPGPCGETDEEVPLC